GAGMDTVDYAGDFGAVCVDLALRDGLPINAQDDVLTGIENVVGTEFGDRLYGDAGVNQLYGNGGDDQLYGNGGDDLLHGGSGGDLLDGGAGTGTAGYAGDFGAVWVDLATGQGRWDNAQDDGLDGSE